MMLSMTSRASAGPTQSNVEVHAYIRSHWSFGDSCNATTSCDLSVVAMHSCELHSKDITLQHRHGSSNNASKGGYPTHMITSFYKCTYLCTVHTYIYMYVQYECMNVCMYMYVVCTVCMCVCMYVDMYVCTCVCLYIHMYVRTYVRIYVCIVSVSCVKCVQCTSLPLC